MKSHLFYIGSNCTIWSLHIYSFAFHIWKGTQTHLRHLCLLHQEALPRTDGWWEDFHSILFFFHWNNNLLWQTGLKVPCLVPLHHSNIWEHATALISNRTRMRPLSFPVWHWGLPMQWFLPYSPILTCSLLPGGLCCLILLAQKSHCWNS